jgi:hypothetical protein
LRVGDKQLAVRSKREGSDRLERGGGDRPAGPGQRHRSYAGRDRQHSGKGQAGAHESYSFVKVEWRMDIPEDVSH